MTSLRYKIALAVIALAAAGAGVLMGSQRSSRTGGGEAADTTTLINLTMADPDGNPQSLVQWRGKVLAVNFWATWCAPCLEEMPEFSLVSKEYAARGVQFVGISIDTADNVRKFNSRLQVSYPLLIGQNDAMQTSVALGNRLMALPFTAILSRNGKLVHHKLGRMRAPELKQALDLALTAD